MVLVLIISGFCRRVWREKLISTMNAKMEDKNGPVRMLEHPRGPNHKSLKRSELHG